MKRRLTRRTRAIVLLCSAILVGVTTGVLADHDRGRPTAARAQDMNGTAMQGMAMADPSSHWAQTADQPFHGDGVTRTYYIGADPVVWDYAPRHRNEITGRPFDAVADTYVKSGPGRIGSRYVKCLYRAYAGASFRHLKRRPADEQYLGLSNLMHSINGYVFGNGPMITVHRGQRVRWYVMSMGTEVDLHTPHWHGNTVTVNGMRMDAVNLLPATTVVADMVPDNPGIWLFHCHVNDHIRAGMLTRYRVIS